MHCLFCAEEMHDISAGSPSLLWECPSCATLCQDLVSMRRGQAWLFANGSSLILTEAALSHRAFCARFGVQREGDGWPPP
jgi:hypothetical protein